MATLPLKLQRAVASLQRGGVIAYPTEAVWGLGCNPHDARAVAGLLELKQRPVEKGLILVGANVEQFAPYLEGLPQQLIDKFGATPPRPTTWLVPVNGYAPDWITGRYTSVALRVSTHKLVRSLCLAYGSPLVSTSANKTGHPPAATPWPLRKWLGRGLDYILPGELGGHNSPSEIRDLISDKVLRST